MNDVAIDQDPRFRDLGFLAAIRRNLEHADDPDQVQTLVAMLDLAAAETEYEAWLRGLFPAYVRYGFAEHHRQFWSWLWSIRLGVRSRPFVGVWPRGGAKSTSVELGVASIAARGTRRYVLYVCETQDQADDHVANIATMLESDQLGRLYPAAARRALGKYGQSKGWKRNRLRTGSGFTLDALGLDTAARGVKMDEQRPDGLVVDDIDDPFDSPGVVTRKLATLSRTLLQAGSEDLITLVIQNLVHPDGVVARLVDGRAEILADRLVSGPIPAIAGAYVIEQTGDTRPMEEGGRPWRIVGGEPTWEGQDRDACERKLADVGPTDWEIEAQHRTRHAVNGMYDDVLDSIVHCTRDEVPDLVRTIVAVDPAVTDKDSSDSHGIQCDGIAATGTIYRLRSWERRASPGEAMYQAITIAYEEGALAVVIEVNQGGDLWRTEYEQALERVLEDRPEWAGRRRPHSLHRTATASTGNKAMRSSRMHADYERPGRIVHVVGDHDVLEAALSRAFVVKPFDLADTAYWSWRELRQAGKGRTSSATGTTIPAYRSVLAT